MAKSRKTRAKTKKKPVGPVYAPTVFQTGTLVQLSNVPKEQTSMVIRSGSLGFVSFYKMVTPEDAVVYLNIYRAGKTGSPRVASGNMRIPIVAQSNLMPLIPLAQPEDLLKMNPHMFLTYACACIRGVVNIVQSNDQLGLSNVHLGGAPINSLDVMYSIEDRLDSEEKFAKYTAAPYRESFLNRFHAFQRDSMPHMKAEYTKFMSLAKDAVAYKKKQRVTK